MLPLKVVFITIMYHNKFTLCHNPIIFYYSLSISQDLSFNFIPLPQKNTYPCFPPCSSHVFFWQSPGISSQFWFFLLDYGIFFSFFGITLFPLLLQFLSQTNQSFLILFIKKLLSLPGYSIFCTEL